MVRFMGRRKKRTKEQEPHSSDTPLGIGPSADMPIPLNFDTERHEARMRRFLPSKQLARMTKEDFLSMVSVPTSLDDFYVSHLSEAHVVELRAAFDRFDMDGSGTISSDEMITVFKSIGSNMTEQEVRDLCERMDTDHSGQVDWPEFVRAMARQLLVCEGDVEFSLAMDLFKGLSMTAGGGSSGAGSSSQGQSIDHNGDAELMARAFGEQAAIESIAESMGGEKRLREIHVDDLRWLLQTAGDPLTDAEMNDLLSLADPEGLGMVPFDRWCKLPCWELPREWDPGDGGAPGLRASAPGVGVGSPPQTAGRPGNSRV